MTAEAKTRELNLDDIQGNVTRAYGRYSYPFARYFFFHIADQASGRAFVEEVRKKVTAATRWKTKKDRPKVTYNIAFNFYGLIELGVPTKTLQGFPSEFADGMKARAFILGDKPQDKVSINEKGEETDQSWCKHWDKIWRDNRTRKPGKDVHIWLSLNAQADPDVADEPVKELEEETQWIRKLCASLNDGVKILKTNGKKGNEEYQAANAIFQTLDDGTKVVTAKEHFGLTDGIGDPCFWGQHPEKLAAKNVIGRGKWMNEKDGWQPLATGEFVLGHPDESQELPPAPSPPEFSLNGSFLIYRKLHENVSTFHEVLDEEAESYAAAMEVPFDEARDTLLGKMVGRWPDGVPLSKVPTYKEWKQFRKDNGFDDENQMSGVTKHYLYMGSEHARDFKYGDDIKGTKCPVGAHLRRVNTRDYLDPYNKADEDNPNATTTLNKRRRILRRGLPYGAKELGSATDKTEQGVIFMVVCANIFRQFEFVQQQWIQYGFDFQQGNNTCPLLGSHERFKRHAIPSDPASGKPPYVMNKLKTFVETRGGDYFFIPSLSALRMISMGIIDPT